VIEQSAESAIEPPVADPVDMGAEREETVADVFGRLYGDGRSYAQAELDRQKLRAAIIGAGVRDAAIFAMVAIMLLFALLVALLIGLIIAFAPALTPLGATAAVLGSTLLVATALLLLAKARIGRMKRAIRG
jgi:hypothetical protein